MKHRTERQVIDDQCMELLKQIVRLRDKTCVTPGKSCGGYLCASHWKPRGQKQVKYDLRNVNCQCSNCNQRHNHYTSFYDIYMMRKYGPEVVLELEEKASVILWKWTIPELREILIGLQKVYDDLSRGR
jgi:hypothetical protein